jgi:hypothetical protein
VALFTTTGDDELSDNEDDWELPANVAEQEFY